MHHKNVYSNYSTYTKNKHFGHALVTDNQNPSGIT